MIYFGNSFRILHLPFFSRNIFYVFSVASSALSAWLKYSVVSSASVSTLCHAEICLHSVSITTACQGHVALPVLPGRELVMGDDVTLICWEPLLTLTENMLHQHLSFAFSIALFLSLCCIHLFFRSRMVLSWGKSPSLLARVLCPLWLASYMDGWMGGERDTEIAEQVICFRILQPLKYTGIHHWSLFPPSGSSVAIGLL